MKCPCCDKPLNGLNIEKSKHNDITVCVHCAEVLQVRKSNLGISLVHIDDEGLQEMEEHFPEAYTELMNYIVFIRQLDGNTPSAN